MKAMRVLGPALAGATLLGSVSLGAPEGFLGFRAASAEVEQQREKAFDAAINPADLRSWLEQMSSEPNQVGSPHDKANADFMLGKFKEWGWDARIETFSVLYPTPKSLTLELVAPVAFKARLSEPAIEGDRTSARTAGALPPYNVYCADGDVTADLVYVNYGMPADYTELERRGVDVKGKVVIVRYGAGWRGLKGKLAEGRGAPPGWRGALAFTYHIGPGPAKVHLAISSDWSLKPIYDVIAVMKGSEFPDQWVIRGNHHDGWVFGAWDPLAGNIAVMAEAKAIGALAKSGWRPRRTLVYASWDGEEPGLLGSTEWAETRADELKRT